MKQYKGLDVTVLWSGGYDSTYLALQLADAGAHVTCVFDTSGTLMKLGDVLNRLKVDEVMTEAGIEFKPVCLEHTYINDRFSSYAHVLKRLVVHLQEDCPVTPIFLGVLKHDQQCNEILDLLEPLNVLTPFTEYTYSEYEELREKAVIKWEALKLLSRCDYGQLPDHPHLSPCCELKPHERWCFKCHENGADRLERFFNHPHLTAALEKIYPNEAIGSLLGYVVVGSEGHKPKFGTRFDHYRDLEPYPHNFEIDLLVTERVTLRKSTDDYVEERPPKKQIVSIYTDVLKKMMGADFIEPICQNSIVASNLIHHLVEQNYLPVGYEWDMHQMKILWSM